jgi:DNA-binding response OmpR family regulator
MTLKVLTIDDDSSMTELLGTLLRKHGMDVYSSVNGVHGIELVKLVNPDIIILDLLLPDSNGWDVCKTLRTFTKAPIAILSALDDPTVISNALDAGADDYMSKPVPSDVLIAHINNLARRYTVELNKTAMMRDVVLSESSSNQVNLR